MEHNWVKVRRVSDGRDAIWRHPDCCYQSSGVLYSLQRQKAKRLSGKCVECQEIMPISPSGKMLKQKKGW